MNAYPIGNDLTVKWSLLYSDGSVFPLSNYDYEFSYRTNRGHKIVTDTSVISVEENILTWTFKGDEQVVSGRYTLCLKITLSGSKVIELQYDNAFMLSPLSGFKGAGSEIVLQSYCDAIDLKDAVLQARKAMDLAADAVINTANSAADAEAAKEAAETTAAQAKADATSAMAMAMEASGKVAVAEQAATDASRNAAAAQQAAQTASNHITSLEQAIAELPDGQAVSEKVAEHTTKLTELESKASPSTQDSIYNSMTFADENGNEILEVTDHIRTKSFDSKNISLKVATLDVELESKVGELKDKDVELESKVGENAKRLQKTPSAENSDNADLTFADENGNEIGGFKDGHVVARFPSPYAKGVTEADLDIADERGNVVLSIRNGFPKTRLFDGKRISDTIKQLKEKETAQLIRDIPENRGVLNAYKKIQQIVNLKWTELSNSHDLFEGESYPREREGTPYSEVLNVDKFIAFNTSIKTFMTAVHNPYSLFYTEDLRKPNPTSGYGFEYENYDGSTWIGPYYGQVCNILVLQAIGLYVNYYSYCFKYLSEIGLFEKVYDQSPQGLKLMDIIWEPGHACIVTDIYRNSRGEVKQIYLSEHNGRSVTNIYTPEQLQYRMDKGGDVIYRYKELYKNLDYTPSEFVAVEDEVVVPYKYNDDICTFAGDDAAFVQGQIIYLNYNKGNYQSIELYKNDELIKTLTLNSSSSIHRHELTSLNLKHGMYKARLVGNGIASDYTRFEIIDAEVSAEKIGEKHRIRFASEEGTPKWISICTANGRHKAVYQLTETDTNNGYAEFNIRELSEAQRLTGAESADKKDISEYELFVKVYFQGEYGNVPNHLVRINL